MPSRASLSLPVSRSISLSLCLAFSLPPFSIPLSPPQLCASLSFHFHQLHPLFHPCAFHSLSGGCPSSSSIIHLALIQDTNRVCLVLIPVTHLASFSRERKRGGRKREREKEGGRETSLSITPRYAPFFVSLFFLRVRIPRCLFLFTVSTHTLFLSYLSFTRNNPAGACLFSFSLFLSPPSLFLSPSFLFL